MKKVTDRTIVGVIVARFQTPFLHEAHKELIQTVKAEHDRVIIFLGLSPIKFTLNNPLDFECRKALIHESFEDITVLYIKDNISDEVWSRTLDTQIRDVIGANQTAILYGSRDSFIPHYRGKFKTQELEQTRFVSATEIRRNISHMKSADFRAGIIYCTMNQFPSVYATVDIAIFNDDETKLLLARKPDQVKWQFVGGFSTPESPSFEDDARRECLEETHLEVGEMHYVGSFYIDDFRYKKEQNKIKTIFYKTKVIFGSPKADDDIAELAFFDIEQLKGSYKDTVARMHIPLVEKLLNINTEGL